MGSVEITLLIINKIEQVLDLGFNRLYVNVDDLDNGFGFLRVLARRGSEYVIVYEDTFELEVSYQVLVLLEESEYDIKDFTVKIGC